MSESLHVHTIPVTPFAQNCNVISCNVTKKAAVVDPGGDIEKIIDKVTELGLTVEKIILTHGHLDHVGGTLELVAHYGVKIEGPHQGDAFWLDALMKQSEMFNFPPASPFHPDRWLVGGDVIEVGEQQLEVRFTPGHTPGHVVFIHHDTQRVFVGDVLFKGSVGRTDFPMGNAAQLKESITQELYTLPEDYHVYPGHGPLTEIGYEKRTNPFTSSRFG